MFLFSTKDDTLMPNMEAHDPNYFVFRDNRLRYNESSHNNFGERAVEIPIAFDFLARLEQVGTLCEIGNVLANYEHSYDPNNQYRERTIVDKYERGDRITTVDALDLPADRRFHTIISISTLEHVEQEHSSEHLFLNRDREAPLKAIAKVYELLEVGGKALVTVPFGKLLDGRWYIQFSNAYLELLVTKYGVPAEALSVHFLRRVIAPEQRWVEAQIEELAHSEYYAPMPYANAIAIIELTRQAAPFHAVFDQPPSALDYADEINQYVLVLAAYNKMIADVSEDVQQQIAQGRSLSEIVKRELPAGWQPWLAQPTAERWIESIYRSLVTTPDATA